MTSYYYYQEKTVWKDNIAAINHIYITDKTQRKMFGYIKGNTGESKIFTTPMPFYPKGREFQLLKVTKW